MRTHKRRERRDEETKKREERERQRGAEREGRRWIEEISLSQEKLINKRSVGFS